MRVRSLLAVVALVATFAQGPASSATQWIVEDPIYIEMPDGVGLEANIYRPDTGASVPAILSYGPYGTGSVALNTAGLNPNYAYVNVSIRGSGCSGGEFDLFSRDQATDGAKVVEWIASRPWSNGKVGMQGNSYLGIIQFFVAAERPPHLVAISPFHDLADLYRDVGYPGGVPNEMFPSLWGLNLQPRQSAQSPAKRLPAGDDRCARNQSGAPAWAANNVVVQGAARPTFDEYYRLRSPITYLESIDIPVLWGQAWQDHQVGSRGIVGFEALRSPKKLVLTNGLHPTAKQTFKAVENRFFEYWLRGVPNGVMDEPQVTVAFELHDNNVSNFTRTYTSWPPAELVHKPLYLRAGGTLSEEAPTTMEEPDTYVYTPGSTWTRDDPSSWSSPENQGLTFETPPLAEDLLMLGPWALTLYASSTATDTDFFVTAYDVAPDGDTTYLQKGLLRASHRGLDLERSTPQRPYHTHTDPRMLEPGTVTRFDIEMLPIGYPLRAGHKLQIKILSPNVTGAVVGLPAGGNARHQRRAPLARCRVGPVGSDRAVWDHPGCAAVRQPRGANVPAGRTGSDSFTKPFADGVGFATADGITRTCAAPRSGRTR